MDEQKQPFGGGAIPSPVNPSPMNSNTGGVSSHKVIPDSTPQFNKFPILTEDSWVVNDLRSDFVGKNNVGDDFARKLNVIDQELTKNDFMDGVDINQEFIPN